MTQQWPGGTEWPAQTKWPAGTAWPSGAQLINSPLSTVGTRPFDASISTNSHVITHLEPLPTTLGLSGNHISSWTSSFSNSSPDLFSETAGSGPTLVYVPRFQVFGAQFVVSAQNWLMNSGNLATRIAGGASKPFSYHFLVRIDDLPNTLGSSLTSVCSHVAAQRYIQQIVTHPASGFDRISISKRGDSGVNSTVNFEGPSRTQFLNGWVVHDGSNTSVYIEGVRISTQAQTNASMTPTRVVMGALFLNSVLSTFASMTWLFETWYDIAVSIAQMREVDDAFTQPRFRTRGNLTNGKLTVIGADGYQGSTAHCATWRTGPFTSGGVTAVIKYTQSDGRAVVLSKPTTSDSWEASGGETPPATNRDTTRDGHDNVSMSPVAGDGTVHYAFDMHGVPMQYGSATTLASLTANGILAAGFGNFLVQSFTYASAALRLADLTLVAGDVGKMARQTDNDSEWVLLTPSPGPTWAQTWGELAFTYPHFILRSNGDILFIGRDGRSGQGWQPVIGKYDAATGIRSHVGAFIFDEGTGPDPYNYYVQICYDSARDIIHMSGVLRHGASAGVESNEGIYYIRSADGGVTWTDIAGTPIALPMSNATAPKILTVPFDREIINQQTMTFDPATGFPIILMHWAPAMAGIIDMHCVSWNGSIWADRTLGIMNQPHSYGAPAGTAGNPGGALPATTGAVIGRAGSLAYNGTLYWWMCASQWGNGVYEFTLPLNNLASGTVTKTKIIADDAYAELGAGALWATWEGQTPDSDVYSSGVVRFTFQRARFLSPTTTAEAIAWPAQPYYLYERTLPGTPITP